MHVLSRAKSREFESQSPERKLGNTIEKRSKLSIDYEKKIRNAQKCKKQIIQNKM